MKLRVVLGTAALAAMLGSPAALADDPPQPPPIPTPPGQQNPWPAPGKGGKLAIAFHVETVTASPGESIFGKAAPQRCTQTNFFARGERVVWHIGAVDARTGKVLTNVDVRYAYLKLPGMRNNIGVTWVRHGSDPATAPWTWTARWDIPPSYPLGLVDFTLVMKLKGWPKNKVATFKQIPIPLEQLTVIDHR